MDALIRMACGTFVLIDEVWYEELSEARWRLTNGYATDRNGRLMHRVIMRAQEGQVIDHINRNPLDNRKANLRFVTHQQNTWNRKKQKSTSKYTGVFPSGYSNRPWYASILIGDKSEWLGSYRTEEEAAYVYDTVAKACRGKYAYLNGVTRPDNFSFAQKRIADRICDLVGYPLASVITPEEIQSVRQKLGCVTIKDFARMVGIHENCVGSWLRGKSSPSEKFAQKIRELGA